MTRALANRLQTLKEPITVNCICPGLVLPAPNYFIPIPDSYRRLVDTGLTQVLIALAPPEYLTPKSTIVRAVTGFIDDDSLTGQVAECSLGNVHYREQPEFGDDGAEYVMTNKFEAEMNKRGVKLVD
jgi:15-hydroxyprostaglandin dehydrogenase (NAD)